MNVSPVGNGADMPKPGNFTSVISKSGGNKYHGGLYLDFENTSMETQNIDATHAELESLGIDVDDEVSRMGDPVPPMFWLRDPAGNSLMIVEQQS